jgi:YD repeat-containing protein
MNVRSISNLILFTSDSPVREKHGNVASVTWSDGTSIKYEYDSSNRLISEAFSTGELYRYTYRNNEIYCIYPNGSIGIVKR